MLPPFDCSGILGTKFQVSEWKSLVVLEGVDFLTYLFVLVCVTVEVDVQSNDVHFGCILLFEWVGPIILGVQIMYFKCMMFHY